MPDIQLLTLEEADPESRIVEAARDLIRARKRELPLEQHLDLLEKAVENCAPEDEFYCWSEEVDRIVVACLGGKEMDEMRRIEWDYSAHFAQKLTRQEAADRLYLFLQEGEQ